jgi:2-oxoglutaroyl-CoA hydrolase
MGILTRRRILNHVYDGPLHLGLEAECLAYALLSTSHNFREGVEAFGEKRKPRFEGR